MGKTINQALKDVFLNLGGDPSELSDNTSVSDYIEDLGGAIEEAAEGAAEAIIDDTAASEAKTYSSSKISSLIPAPELPEVTSSDNGKVLGVTNGAWGVENIPSDVFIVDGVWAGNDMFYPTGQIMSNLTQKEVCDMVKSGKMVAIQVGVAMHDVLGDATMYFSPSFANSNAIGNATTITFSYIYRKTNSTVYCSLSLSCTSTSKLQSGVGPFSLKEVNDPATT